MSEQGFDLGRVVFDERRGGDACDVSQWKSLNTNVKMYHYPFCCTGLVMANLGGRCNAFGGANRVDDLKGIIQAWIAKFEGDGEFWEHKKQFISVCTTDNQKLANATLEELGFTRSEPANNTKYGGKLYTWMLSINVDAVYDAECDEDDEDEEEE